MSHRPWHQLPITLVSLVATPFVVFISSSHGLYVNNQHELNYQSRVLLPFVGLFLVTFILGMGLLALRRRRGVNSLLCAYYLAGPFYLLFLFLQSLPVGNNFFLWLFDTPAGVLAYAASFIWTVYRLSPLFDINKVSKLFALFATLLFALEVPPFLARLEPHPPVPTSVEVARSIPSQPNLPNIYHIVMDAFQSDYFDMLLDSDTKAALRGFAYFPRTKAVYELTRRSLPSVFSGRYFRVDMPWRDYQQMAMNSESSFLFWLKREGYTTIAYSPRMYTFETTLYDLVIEHEDNPRTDELLEMNTSTFERLWLYASAPRLITRWMMDTDWFIQYGVDQDMRLMKNERFLAYSRPIESYFSFLSYMDQEQYLPDSGRYTFVHLLIPHPPEVFDPACSYQAPAQTIGPLSQTQCAVKLMKDFVALLKRLGRYDDSLIILQGDHGNFYRYEDGHFISTDEVSPNALLLIKPIGASGPFTVSEAESTLLDIAPTLLYSLGIEHDLEFDGSVLDDAVGAHRGKGPPH